MTRQAYPTPSFASLGGGTQPLSLFDGNFGVCLLGPNPTVVGRIPYYDTVGGNSVAAGYPTSPAFGTLVTLLGLDAGNSLPAVVNVTATGSTTARSLADRFSDVFNVRDYGAKGDGVTDDTAAVQACITAAGVTNGIVFIEQGTYQISSTLTVSSGCYIWGTGFNTILRPTADGVGTVLSLTTGDTEVHNLSIASAFGAPTYTAININAASGFKRMDDIYISGAGVGINVPQCNAGRFANMRIGAVTCVQTGGTNAVFPGDITWTEVVCVPTAAGTGWIIDGNSNAQYLTRVEIIGGAICLNLRGAGGGTSIPDGTFLFNCNFTASSGAVMQILKGRNTQILNTVIGGSTAGDGILINPASTTDVDGVMVLNSQNRANFQRGINWQGGGNLQVIGGQCYGNSDGGGSGTFSNILVGANATGLCQIVGCMLGLGSTGNIFANIQAPTKYGIELAASSLTTSGNFVGRLFVVGNMLQGNTTGTISDASAPTGVNKFIGEGQHTNATPQVISVTGSPFTYTAGGSPETVYIRAGTVSLVVVGGVTLLTASPGTVSLEPGQAVVVTYSVGPTMISMIR